MVRFVLCPAQPEDRSRVVPLAPAGDIGKPTPQQIVIEIRRVLVAAVRGFGAGSGWRRWALGGACLLVLTGLRAEAAEDLPPFVEEVAPGVFVRDLNGIYGSNQVFVLFKDFVVVFDGSRFDQGRALDEEIRARTDKPIRYVVHSHFHPDHTLGAAALTLAPGAEILASIEDKKHYEEWCLEDFAAKKAAEPELYAGVEFPMPTRYLTEPEVFDDGEQRLEIRHLGHGHTAGDVVGWMPKYGILLSGDVVENHSYYNIANGNLESWVEVIDELLEWPIKTIIPGHGHVGGVEMAELSRRFFFDLRQQVAGMVERGMNYEQVVAAVDIPYYEEWTGRPIRENRRGLFAVYLEVGGTFPMSPKKKLAIQLAAAAGGLLVLGGGGFLVWRRARARKAGAA